MLSIRVPATSANIGSGFDSLGLALSQYNTVQMDFHKGLLIEQADGARVPCDERNLIYKTVKKVFEHFERPLPGLFIRQKSGIPMTKGLGSSSACIVAGIVGANALLGGVMDKDEMINLACRIEGHPDNVAPALLGGFVAAVFDGVNTHAVKVNIARNVGFVAFVPDFALRTEVARAALPKSLPFEDAVFNLSRAALMSVSLSVGDFKNIAIAVEDRLHQQYRLPLIPGGEQVFGIAKELSAYGTYISGAGPTIMSIVNIKNKRFLNDAQEILKARMPSWQAVWLTCDEQGAVIIEH